MFELLAGFIIQYLSASRPLAVREMSLATRNSDSFVNEVMKKNILLTRDYLGGEFTIEPGKTVSFHDIKLPKYAQATPLLSVHFSMTEGFLSDGWLVGDGVCHIASLLAWAARDAGLSVDAPTRHDFARIPEIPREQGVSIYANPYQPGRSQPQNLYIQNTRETPVKFVVSYEGDVLGVSVLTEETNEKLHQTNMSSFRF